MAELNTDYSVDLLGRATKAMMLRRTAIENAMAEEQMTPEAVQSRSLMRNIGVEQAQETLAATKGANEQTKMAIEQLKKTNPLALRNLYLGSIAKQAPLVSYQQYVQGGRDEFLRTADDFGIRSQAERLLPTSDMIEQMAVKEGIKPEEAFEKLKTNFVASYKEQTERMTAEAHLKAALKGEKGNFQEKGITEKGSLTVIFDPGVGRNYVVNEQGERVLYNANVHGRIMPTTTPQSQTEIKLDNYVETALASRYPGFVTDPKVREQAYKDFADPKNKKLKNEVVSEANEMAKARAVPIVVQTDTGPMVIDRGKGTAKPVTGPGGTTVPRLTPSEVNVAYAALVDNTNSINAVKEAYDSGVVGPVTGRARRLGAKFFSDTELTRLQNRVGQLRTIIYGLSGKQINEAEQKWLDNEIIPNLKQPSDNFEVTLVEFEQWVKRKMGSFEKLYPGVERGKAAIKDTGKKEITTTERPPLSSFVR